MSAGCSLTQPYVGLSDTELHLTEQSYCLANLFVSRRLSYPTWELKKSGTHGTIENSFKKKLVSPRPTEHQSTILYISIEVTNQQAGITKSSKMNQHCIVKLQ